MKHVDYSKIVYVCVCVYVCVLSSCRPDTVCRDNMVVGLVCELRHTYLEKDQPQTATSLDSLTIIGIGQTEPLYSNAKWQTQLILPMHTQTDSTRYTILYHQLLDTICIYHSNQIEFVSLECGCSTNHALLKMTNTKHWIDSVAIVNTNMTRNADTNIQIWVLDN